MTDRPQNLKNLHEKLVKTVYPFIFLSTEYFLRAVRRSWKLHYVELGKNRDELVKFDQIFMGTV